MLEKHVYVHVHVNVDVDEHTISLFRKFSSSLVANCPEGKAIIFSRKMRIFGYVVVDLLVLVDVAGFLCKKRVFPFANLLKSSAFRT
jgi:hypothetical protein